MSGKVKRGQSSGDGRQVNQRVNADGLSMVEEVDCTESSAKNKRSKDPKNKVKSSNKGDQGEYIQSNRGEDADAD